MSTTPSDTLPPAIGDEGAETRTLMQRATDQAGRIAGLARDNPKAAITAGAAVAAGVAAAAIPLVRAARRKSANGSTAAKADGAASPARKRPARRAKKS
jgi:hypothetical protein